MNTPFSSSPSPEPLELVEATAATWLALRDGGMDEGQTAAFIRWLEEDPRHAHVFGELDRTWSRFGRLEELRPVAALHAFVRDKERPRRNLVWSMAAALLVMALGFTVWQQVDPRAQRQVVVTEIGALRVMELPDGSTVHLNTDTQIRLRYAEAERRVELVRGEAHFAVKPDAARPFVVTAGAVQVRAVGTAFNVRRRADEVEVLVTSGRVVVEQERPVGEAGPPPEINAPLLEAGQRVVLTTKRVEFAAPNVEQVQPLEIERTMAWQERRLVFDGTPLREVVAEFNRYNQRQLVIDDPILAERLFGGTFRADNYEALVQLLEEAFEVEVLPMGNRTLLRRAR
jgi:transmembrane sensor